MRETETFIFRQHTVLVWATGTDSSVEGNALLLGVGWDTE